MSENILGISAYFHDSAVALIQDGRITFAAQEERYSRLKNDSRFPCGALDDCLKACGIAASDISHVVYYENPRKKFSRLWEGQLARAPRCFRSFDALLSRWSGLFLPMHETLRTEMGAGFKGEIHCVEHHGAHAAAAFYPSPFDDAAILTLDAVGEQATSAIGTGHDSKIQLLQETRFPHSLGLLYSALTYYLGFEVNEGEYKVMGLAPYGKPKFRDEVLSLMKAHEAGAIELDMSYFDFVHGRTMIAERFHQVFGSPPREASAPITQRHIDIAASVQKVTEEVILAAAHECHRVTGKKNLCMAGGVALNCVANGRVQREGPFERIWIQPAAGDAGSALGAALLFWHQGLGKPRHVQPTDSQQGSLLGPAFLNTDVRAYLDSIGASYECVEDDSELLDRVAQLLSRENIVGWFSGRMEYGPRALGSRSILADPRPGNMQKRLNLSIKFRESFRPFAAAVLKEHASECFEVPDAGADSPYMLFVHPVAQRLRVDGEDPQAAAAELPERLAARRSTLQAITHVDYSSRIQTIDEERHGRFDRLLRAFHRRTGCAVLINTSFNVRGEPIVRTPEDAFHCFMKTGLDYLVVENCLIDKTRQPQGLAGHIAESY